MARVNRAFEMRLVPPVLRPDWRTDALVFIGDAGGKLFTRSVSGRTAVAIDLDPRLPS